MPPRLALKSDESFFEKISTGAVGARAVAADLNALGHRMSELEGGSTDTKMWKDVKRKRVRIPDLVCVHCGLRVESRAKSEAVLSMSHSGSDVERSWSYGMVDSDVVAFPVCQAVPEESWARGQLGEARSYWHKRSRVLWQPATHINYFRVAAFRAVPPSASSTKGVTEGSETSISWDAIFSTFAGTVEAVSSSRISMRRALDGRRIVRLNRKELPAWVAPGEQVEELQVMASAVEPLSHAALHCPGDVPGGHISRLLSSPERTQRFTGARLARLRADPQYRDTLRKLLVHEDEDLYVKLEAAGYLAGVCGESARELFGAYLNDADPQVQLESVVALSNVATDESRDLLCGILGQPQAPFFLRSAVAWALGVLGGDGPVRCLVQAFADVDPKIREESLEAVCSIGGPAFERLLAAVTAGDLEIAAGSAEAIRRVGIPRPGAVRELVAAVKADPRHVWAVWLLSQLPTDRDYVAQAVAELQDANPAAHYAVTVLWAFVHSWVAKHWELHPDPETPHA